MSEPSLHRFKQTGIDLFNAYLVNVSAGAADPPPEWLLTDPMHSEEIAPEIPVPAVTFSNRLAAARHVDALFARAELSDVDRDEGLWAWLSLRFFDQLCPPDKDGKRKPGEVSDGVFVRLIPAIQRNRRYYRHLLLGPYLIMRAYRAEIDSAMALLADAPHVATAEAYRLFVENPSLISCRAAVGTATALYYDKISGRMRRGYGRKTSGGCRRLIQVLQQFDCTYDLYSLSTDTLLAMLPNEFDEFRPEPLLLAI